MAATCENFEKVVLNWMFTCIKQGRRVGYANMNDLAQKLGFSTSINEAQMTIWKDDDEFNSIAPIPSERDLISEDLLSVIIEALRTRQNEESSQFAHKSPTIKSPKAFSPSREQDISVQLPTSSPISQNNVVASNLRKIISLAKDSYNLTTGTNSSFGKAPFNHRRLSDIKISPLAELANNSNELNLTKCIDAPSISNLTPKRAKITKPDVQNETYSAKKSLLQPVKAKLQSFQSKLRTPIPSKNKSTTNITRSAGLSRLPAPRVDKRLSSTPNGQQKPSGTVSRFSYSQFKRVVK